jgi:hypothetical protein
MLVVPATAQAVRYDLGVTVNPSARTVSRGQSVSFDITITNHGTEAFEASFVNLFSLRGHGLGANNPYTSVSTSQGACKDVGGEAFNSHYYTWVCELGALAPGASAKIKAAVTVNESMNHIVALLPNAYEGGYQDENNSNVTGSKAIKLKGLPTGCTTGDFTLRASTKAAGVKKMSATMEYGYTPEGVGQDLRKIARGHKLVVNVPASHFPVELGKSFELHIKAKKGGGRKLETVVLLTPCGA